MWSNRIASWFIFLNVASFLNLLAKYITFKIAKGCSYQDISTVSKSTPLKAHPSFLYSRSTTLKHAESICVPAKENVRILFIDFFMFQHLTNINVGTKRENTKYIRINKRTNWLNCYNLYPISFTSQFIRKISLFKKVMYAFIKTFLQLPNLHLWKLR